MGMKKFNQRSKRNKYDKVESDIRRKLLYLVKDLKVSIKDAAQYLGINYSTSKTILQLFRRTGRIDRLERKYLLQMQINR
jgi:transposase